MVDESELPFILDGANPFVRYNDVAMLTGVKGVGGVAICILDRDERLPGAKIVTGLTIPRKLIRQFLLELDKVRVELEAMVAEE